MRQCCYPVHACEANLKKLNSVAPQSASPPADPESLGLRLSAYREQSARLRPDFAKAYDELVDRLTALDRGEVGPGTGEPMPLFNLPDETGRLVSLSSMLQSGPVVISINRGHWCPYCKMELRSLAAIHGEIRRLGARVVSIMPDSAQFTGDYVSPKRIAVSGSERHRSRLFAFARPDLLGRRRDPQALSKRSASSSRNITATRAISCRWLRNSSSDGTGS